MDNNTQQAPLDPQKTGTDVQQQSASQPAQPTIATDTTSATVQPSVDQVANPSVSDQAEKSPAQAMQSTTIVRDSSINTSSITASDKVSGTRPTQEPITEQKQEESVGNSSSDLPTTTPDPVPAQTQPSPPIVGGPAGKELEARPLPMPDISKLSDSEIQEEEKQVETAIENLIVQSPADKKPEIPEEAKTAGVELAAHEMEFDPNKIGTVSLPMTFDEALKTQRKSRIRDSLKWLTTLIIYHWKKLRAKPEEDDSSAFG